MKSYTDIEQSKKLAEILPIESADMHYKVNRHNNETKIFIIPYSELGYYKDNDYQYCIPCWSLDALLEVMPQYITKYIESERCQKTFRLNLFRSYYHCCSYSFVSSVSDDDGNNTLYCTGRDSWIDACYEMILKLNELKLL